MMKIAGATRAPNSRMQRGYSLVELSLVLIVIAVLAGAGFYIFQSNLNSSATSTNVGQITRTAADLQRKFGQSNQYSSLATGGGGITVAVQSHAVPDELIDTSVNPPVSANNTYGGAVDIFVAPAADCGGTAGACVDLKWPSVPQNQCADLVTGTQQVARRILVAGTVVKPLDGTLNVATLATQCSTGAGPVTIDYEIGRS